MTSARNRGAGRLSVPTGRHPRRFGTASGRTRASVVTLGGAVLVLATLPIGIPVTAWGQADSTTPGPVSGRAVTAAEMTPADVLARVELLRDELELIRFEMGEPRARRAELDVTDASPRQVMFQAFTLYLKAKQLRFELTGTRGDEVLFDQPPEVRPLHVWRVVDVAYGRLLVAKHALGIGREVRERLQDSSTTPTDVFRAIQLANRQFDVLLKQQLSAADVFHQVRQATHYAARLLGQFPEAAVMPPVPAFEHGRRPVEVYNRLVEGYERLGNVARRSGLEPLQLRVSRLDASIDDPSPVSPSDVYDVAVLLVSELAYLDRALYDDDVPAPALDFGFKLPADVYQQAGRLLAQLTDLERLVDANPRWLDDSARR